MGKSRQSERTSRKSNQVNASSVPPKLCAANARVLLAETVLLQAHEQFFVRAKPTLRKNKTKVLPPSNLPPRLMQTMYGHGDAGIFGYTHLAGTSQAYKPSMSTYRTVTSISFLVPIPSPTKRCSISTMFSTSDHCVCDVGVNQGNVVAVWGLGSIGICIVKRRLRQTGFVRAGSPPTKVTVCALEKI